MTLSVKGLGMG